MKIIKEKVVAMYKGSNNLFIQQIIEEMKKKAYARYGPSKLRRSAHTKTLAVLSGNFKVREDLPKGLKKGIFNTAIDYPAWIRISSSSSKVHKDSKKDVRGFAIKLETDKGPQDFILVSTKYMPLRTIKGFHGAINLMGGRSPLKSLVEVVKDTNFPVLFKLFSTMEKDKSPLELCYFSLTPYAFGKYAVKYALVPTSVYRGPKSQYQPETYLKDSIKQHLKNQEATFDFMIQFKKQGMSLEDASEVWDEERSPFIKVGEVIIPPQIFDTAERYRLGEKLTYSPANALPDHRPLGGLNHGRALIYKSMQKFRKTRE